MYKLVALDVDGTTFNKDHIVTENTKKAIKKLQTNNIKIVFVSGREPLSIRMLCKDLGVNGLISGMNGAIVANTETDRLIRNITLPKKDVLDCLALVDEMGFSPFVFVNDDTFVISKEDDFVKIIDKFTENELYPTGDMISFLEQRNLLDCVSKVGIAHENRELQLFKKEYEKRHGNLNQVFSLPFFLEIIRKDVSKANALKFIADEYNIKPEEIIAVGDGENDIEMLKFAGLGVAMGNAPDNVKAAADEVTSSNNEDGVAKIINKYFPD